MAKTNFIEVAPKLIADAFAEVGAGCTSGAEYIAAHNARYAEVIQKVGKTIMNSAEYSNSMDFMYEEGLSEGEILEMVCVQVDAWINDVSQTPASLQRDQLKQYPPKIMAAYSDLNVNITAPVTIHDKNVKQAMVKGAEQEFYTSHLIEMKNAIDWKRELQGKEFINRCLLDHLNSDRYIVMTGITGITEDNAVSVFGYINSVVGEFQTGHSKYNVVGYRGKTPKYDASGRPNIIVLGRTGSMRKLQTYASTVFHKDSLLMEGVEFREIDNFGGLLSSVGATYDAGDGSQTANMRQATFTDPNKEIQFIIFERGAFLAGTNWEDVESRRDVGARATTFEPLSSHIYALIPWKPFAVLAFADTTKAALTAGDVTRTSDTKASIKFSSSKPGTYYYGIVADGATAPSIDTTGAGFKCYPGVNTIVDPIGLEAGAKDLYIKVKDRQGVVSDALKVDIAG